MLFLQTYWNAILCSKKLSYFNSKPHFIWFTNLLIITIIVVHCSSIQYININTFKKPLTEQYLMFNCKAASPKVPCPLYKSRITLANTWYCIFNGDVFRSIRLTVDWPKQAAWLTLTLSLMAEKHLKEACVTECCPWGLQTLTVFHDKLLTLRGE